jgi:hypothetical protein
MPNYPRFSALLEEAEKQAATSRKELSSFLALKLKGSESTWYSKISKWKGGGSVPSNIELSAVAAFFREKDVAFPLDEALACFYPPSSGAAPPAALLPDSPPVPSGPDQTPNPDSRGKSWVSTPLLLGVLIGFVAGGGAGWVARGSRVEPSGRSIFDFENGHDSWGRYLPGGTPAAGAGVTALCDASPAARSGRCTLVVSTLDGPDTLIGTNKLPGPAEEAEFIEAYVAAGPDPCTDTPPRACSTAKVFVLDANDTLHEGVFVELGSGWRRVQLAIDPEWRRPFKNMGVHVFVAPGFGGPVYIDAMTAR